MSTYLPVPSYEFTKESYENLKDGELLHDNVSVYMNGQIFRDCYIDSKRRMQGKYIEFYEDGSILKECNYVDDKLHGEYLEYNTNKVLIKYYMFVNGQKEGEQFEFSHRFDGIITKNEFYIDGKKNHFGIEFYEDGGILKECCYLDDSLHGEYLEYHSTNSLLRSRMFIRGKLEGEQFEFYPQSGIIRENVFYKNNRRQGVGVTNFSDGTCCNKSNCKNGVLDGIQVFYSSDEHRKKSISVYKSGAIVYDKDIIKRILVQDRFNK